MISAILQPLSKQYSRLIALGNTGEMEATALPTEIVRPLPTSYHNGFQPGSLVEHRHGAVYPVDLASKFGQLAEQHAEACYEINEFRDNYFVHSREIAWREMQQIASILLPDDECEETADQGADPEVIRCALEGDALARYELYSYYGSDR